MKLQSFAVLDRVEEDKAVLLFGDEEAKGVIPVACLPPEAEEGDYLTISIEVDDQKTRAARAEAAALYAKLQAKD